MNDMIEKSVCFTGHREIIHSDLYDRLYEVVKVLVEDGFERFICGGALGFDMLAAKCVLDLKGEFENIKLIIAIPCRGQDKYWTTKQQEAYKRMLAAADETIVLSESYHRGCMHNRNRYMVDNSSVCVSYVCKDEGGSQYTVGYAKKCNRTVINIV